MEELKSLVNLGNGKGNKELDKEIEMNRQYMSLIMNDSQDADQNLNVDKKKRVLDYLQDQIWDELLTNENLSSILLIAESSINNWDEYFYILEYAIMKISSIWGKEQLVDQYLSRLLLWSANHGNMDFSIANLKEFHSTEAKMSIISQLLDLSSIDDTHILFIENILPRPNNYDNCLVLTIKIAFLKSQKMWDSKYIDSARELLNTIIEKKWKLNIFDKKFVEYARPYFESLNYVWISIETKDININPNSIINDWDRWTCAENLIELSLIMKDFWFDPSLIFQTAVDVAKMHTNLVNIDYLECADSIRKFNHSIPETALKLWKYDLAEKLCEEFMHHIDYKHLFIKKLWNQKTIWMPIEEKEIAVQKMVEQYLSDKEVSDSTIELKKSVWLDISWDFKEYLKILYENNSAPYSNSTLIDIIKFTCLAGNFKYIPQLIWKCEKGEKAIFVNSLINCNELEWLEYFLDYLIENNLVDEKYIGNNGNPHYIALRILKLTNLDYLIYFYDKYKQYFPHIENDFSNLIQNYEEY